MSDRSIIPSLYFILEVVFAYRNMDNHHAIFMQRLHAHPFAMKHKVIKSAIQKMTAVSLKKFWVGPKYNWLYEEDFALH